MSALDRIAFGTDGWRDDADAFTDERVRAVAQAFLHTLETNGTEQRIIAIGFDARPNSRAIANVLAETATTYGYDVLLADRDCPTPAIASLVADRGLAGGLMVTASHNPPKDNGIKIIDSRGASAPPSITDAIVSHLGMSPTPCEIGGSVEHIDLVDRHIRIILERLDVDLTGLTIAYDAMHGSGRGVLDNALEQAGATVERLRCTRDSSFGGDAPHPTRARLSTLRNLVESSTVDLGLATDGDADRIAVVTPEGFLDANLLFAIIYEDIVSRQSGSAVRTVSTTHLIDRIAQAHDETVFETAVGFKWVADAMDRHGALIGGEDSGGFALRDHVLEKDGAFSGLLCAHVHKREPLQSRLSSIHSRYGRLIQDSTSLRCMENEKQTVMANIDEQAPTHFAGIAVESINQLDGLKYYLENGDWLLIRPSGTEPKLRVHVESADSARIPPLLEAGTAFLKHTLRS